MVKGPKNMFKTIFDLRRPSGPNKVPWTVVPQIVIFWSKFFKRVCLCVQILFGGVCGPEGSQRVIPPSEKLSDLAPIPTVLCREPGGGNPFLDFAIYVTKQHLLGPRMSGIFDGQSKSDFGYIFNF